MSRFNKKIEAYKLQEGSELLHPFKVLLFECSIKTGVLENYRNLK